MAYSATIRDEIFERLGVYANWWYQLDQMKAFLAERVEEAVVDFNIRNVGGFSDTPSAADKVVYEALSAEVHRQQEVLDSLRESLVNAVSDFFAQNVSELLGSPQGPPAGILDTLIAYMAGSGDTVETGGRFYTFVDENYEKEFPTSGSPTISDTLAGAT